ncbi:Putative 4-hydroxy-2-oxoglutarate aldolase, mitochondrial [Fulvia fulva]|uniref:4-hydroxy-2-oxoglutarate aldolase, mitochondrial n=1 Tax=Passalora fulva TaxID=5499 RepID=A0A9Q8P2T9_PASFU|nr:Putative 4-hydroxy-2-oxoglutarate aldolase, mitochondrial [Fulvia fulva]KAK4634642.1 putative 4-hydroxy-2-oxoglutarate aldolase, mitochondrial [Fulvia fulva]KAK4636691.1 putative 4-hydroxy-2-oxoglutarate aldolase, mitochondrial [Fulvia fulva]UJO11295.1 Putative 4-hydroxy-2-oxoglutarate aldolase, mitochondrial [Fulvia fulva]WPV10343.1 Putative 4-hydroxy-2-oxoglutarate aldolase, mitochondrial [Fulvia fulva]WPV24260.1 Putative 4-hydroxy-2-oxoglutarate aldolase, mitochondrial [Fulvia fulva]
MNGSTHSNVPPAGIWAPAVTFYDNDELDLTSQAKYYKYMSKHLTGLVILGTNAETFMLTRDERAALLKTAREAVGDGYPIMAGVGGHSTKQVLEFISDASAAGANYALVLPCAYFGKQTTPKVINTFYSEVAEKSPLPIVIYNFPAVCNGIDIDSDVMVDLAKKYPGKIVGTKLTCASVGKITRLASTFESSEFATYGGQSDFLIGGLAVGSAGCIAAFANIFPKTVRHIYELYKQGKHEEALKLHGIAANAESFSKAGIANTKFAVSVTTARSAGIEDAEAKLVPRRPYEPPTDAVKKDIRAKMEEMIKIEDSL